MQKESATPKGVAFLLASLPRVASYRRQPWAIESTTPIGLPGHQPLIIAPQPGDEDNIALEFIHHSPFINTPSHGISSHRPLGVSSSLAFATE